MFGLGEEVGRDIGRIGRFIRNDANLRRPCNHIDAHKTKDLFFGCSDIDVARPCNLVHLGNGFRSVGQGSYALSTTDLVNLIDPCQSGRDQNSRYKFLLRGRNHDDFLDTRNLSRNHIHQDR